MTIKSSPIGVIPTIDEDFDLRMARSVEDCLRVQATMNEAHGVQ